MRFGGAGSFFFSQARRLFLMKDSSYAAAVAKMNFICGRQLDAAQIITPPLRPNGPLRFHDLGGERGGKKSERKLKHFVPLNLDFREARKLVDRLDSWTGGGGREAERVSRGNKLVPSVFGSDRQNTRGAGKGSPPENRTVGPVSKRDCDLGGEGGRGGAEPSPLLLRFR